MFFRKKKPSIPRKNAFAAVPRKLPVARTKERNNGGLTITVRFARPRWHRWVGTRTPLERTFGLDRYGRFVYDACDGSRTVRKIVQKFAHRFHMSVPEAEMAVTTFLKTLVSKGMVALEIPSKESD